MTVEQNKKYQKKIVDSEFKQPLNSETPYDKKNIKSLTELKNIVSKNDL